MNETAKQKYLKYIKQNKKIRNCRKIVSRAKKQIIILSYILKKMQTPRGLWAAGSIG